MVIKKLTNFNDARGDLIPIEFEDLPFVPKRIFIVKNVPVRTIRGEHAHHKNQQYLICLKGKIEVVLHNGFKETSKIIKEGESVLIKNLIWDYQKFMTKDSILLVLCSIPYSIKDYIFNFEKFKRIVL